MSNLYPHNQEIYDGIIRAIADGYKKIGYTEATGLGKSFVFIELCKTIFKGKKILYVVPKVCISEAITFYTEYKFISDYVDFTTYAMFNSEDKALEFAEKYDVLFADECHHLLSDIQGCNVDICGSLIAEKVGGFYIGMSATTVVKKKSVMDEFFDTCIVGLDLYDAIINGIYPKLDYRVAIPDTDDIPKDMLVKYNIECSKPMLESILIDTKVHKVLMYFSNKKELKDNVKYAKSLFKGYKIFQLYSEYGRDNDKILYEFNNCKEDCILMSVFMVVEGVHADGVDCAIIFRNVVELHTLLQLVGRLFYYNMQKTPLIIDVTNSFKLFKKNARLGLSLDNYSTERSLRDIINPICLGFRIVDFMDEYLNRVKRFILIDYKGITCFSAKELADSLGIQLSTLRGYCSRNKGCSAEDIVDYYLSSNNDKKVNLIYPNAEGEYRGVKYPISITNLAKTLGVPRTTVDLRARYCKNSFCRVIDYFRDEYIEKKDRCICWCIEKPYKGIPPFSTKRELIEMCQSGILSFSNNLIDSYYTTQEYREGNASIYSLLDYLISSEERVNKISDYEKFWKMPDGGYRGLEWKNKVDLACELGYTPTYLTQVKGKMARRQEGVGSITVKDIIDYLIDEAKCIKLKNEYRGFKPFVGKAEFGRVTGLSIKTVDKIVDRNNLRTGESLVDYYLDVYSKKEVL